MHTFLDNLLILIFHNFLFFNVWLNILKNENLVSFLLTDFSDARIKRNFTVQCVEHVFKILSMHIHRQKMNIF